MWVVHQKGLSDIQLNAKDEVYEFMKDLKVQYELAWPGKRFVIQDHGHFYEIEDVPFGLVVMAHELI